ncbi:hypothetical protein DV737_g4711, partial [Chaetothyriales sp. CBS 132003]
MSENILFDGQFTVTEVNSSKYDRVCRISATSVGGGSAGAMQMILDINSEIWKVEKGANLNVQLALSLNLDGSKDDGKGYREVGRGEQTLADEFDYVMYGKIYRFQESNGENIKVYVSFGGLLMYIDGPYALLNALRIDNVYLLMKK